MKAVVQRCSKARVAVGGEVVGAIEHGLVVFLGVMRDDGETQAQRLADKLLALRIFDDEDGKFNYAVGDVAGAILLISNFTVCGDTRKGSRPSFSAAAAPGEAQRLYEHFATLLALTLKEHSVPVETGIFAADMQVLVENDGPVTVVVEVP